MRNIKLITTTRETLYEGLHASVKEAVESALSKNIALHYIDLSYCELCHINLDGVFMNNACFREANLVGANMSEAKFFDCDFAAANLSDACLCYSDLTRCNFRYAHFGGADISMSSIDFCDFQGQSLCQLDLNSAYRLAGLAFYTETKIYRFANPPSITRNRQGTTILFESG